MVILIRLRDEVRSQCDLQGKYPEVTGCSDVQQSYNKIINYPNENDLIG